MIHHMGITAGIWGIYAELNSQPVVCRNTFASLKAGFIAPSRCYLFPERFGFPVNLDALGLFLLILQRKE